MSTEENAKSVASVRAPSRVSQTMVIIALVWFAAVFTLGFSGLLSTYSRFNGLFVVVPLVVFVIVFVVSSSVRAWAFAFDTRTLVMFQMFRLGGIAFLAVYAVGKLSGTFALWAGLLDCAIGVSALFVVHSLTPLRTARQRGLLLAWMGVGIVDFVVAIPLALLARIADPASMVAITFPPLSLITTYAVPLALIDYFILSAHLWQQRRQA